jgi:hypothetical protein
MVAIAEHVPSICLNWIIFVVGSMDATGVHNLGEAGAPTLLEKESPARG